MAKLLPALAPHVIDGVTQWLVDRDDKLRSRQPEATAKFLVLCAKLHLQNRPFPTYKEAAEHLGVSLSLITAALSARVATKDISISLKFIEGNVKRRVSTKRLQMIKPSDELLQIVAYMEYKYKQDHDQRKP